MPVIVTASDLLLPIDGNIHYFVIDGYRTNRTEYTHHHYFVWDVPPSEPYIPYEDYMTTSLSPATFTSIKINWGWWTQWSSTPVNDGWYTLTGNWVVTNRGETYDYNHNLKMMYGFAV